MNRVQSKHLFTYQPTGVLDDEVVAMEAKMGETTMTEAVEEFQKIRLDDDCKVVAYALRKLLSDMMRMYDISLKEVIDNCVQNEFKVSIRDGNDFEVPVFVHTPKHLVGNTSNAAIIYAHGGGAVAGDAAMFKGICSGLAMTTGVVYFNVDYRIAPETKCPKNALDFYCAIKHICENAEELGIDASRIAIAGESGGGYICFAAMVMLAQRNESDLVKLAIPSIPMISDYSFSDMTSMTKEEREAAPNQRKIWHCIADDFEAQRNDPLLFPAKASDEILQKMPPTIIWENEFDLYITEATRMAHRMRREGRLLEFRVQPGMTHVSSSVPGTKGSKINMDDLNLAIKEYLL